MKRACARGAAGLLLSVALAAAAPLDGDADYAVRGVVVDSRSHAPLDNVRVALAPSSARDRKVEQVTKQDGRFSFPVSEPGKYSLSIAKPGYPQQHYKQAGFAGVSSAIVVREGQDTSHVVFEARRGSVLAGRVKDEDSEPVGNALVAIFQSAIVDGDRRIIARGQTRANAAGEFRFSSLPQGNYYVCAMGRPWFADTLIELEEMRRIVGRRRGVIPANPGGDQLAEPEQPAPSFSPDPGFRGTAFATTFYPNAQSIEQASLVRLDVGETQVSIALPLTRGVTVKGTMNVPGEASDGRVILYKKAYVHYVSFLEGWVGKDGTFEFKNVPAGSYEIWAASQANSGASSWSVLEEVVVGASDLEVTLRPQQMGSLSGHVLFEGERPAAPADLFVNLHNEAGSIFRSEVSSGGSFSVSRLPVGRYEVTGGNGSYIAAYFTGVGGERLPLNMAVSSGETVRRDLTLTRAVSTIEGTVEKEGVPQVGAFVLLMPKDQSQRWAYRVDQTDSDGSYRLSAIPSGDYSVIALSEGDDVAYRNAKVAARLNTAARPIHVEAGEHLDLKLDVVSTATLELSSL